jgi:hypothetical protein
MAATQHTATKLNENDLRKVVMEHADQGVLRDIPRTAETAPMLKLAHELAVQIMLDVREPASAGT